MLENLKNPCERCSISWECSDGPDENCESYMIYQAQCSILREVVDWLRYILSLNKGVDAEYYITPIILELEQLLKEGKHE